MRKEDEHARIRLVSAPTQIMLKNEPGIDRQADESGRASVWIRVLGRLFCPHRPKRTAADEMGRPIEVALIVYTYKSIPRYKWSMSNWLQNIDHLDDREESCCNYLKI